jgi:hypothetical protein
MWVGRYPAVQSARDLFALYIFFRLTSKARSCNIVIFLCYFIMVRELFTPVLFVQVKAIREHFWKNYIKKLFEEKILRGNIEHLCGILDRDHFEINFKNIRKVEEEKTCSVVFTLIY